MKKESARALILFAAILVFVGWLVMSPAGAFAIFVLSVILAVVPAVFGRGTLRVAAAILLLVSIISAISKYPEFKHEHNMHQDRVKKVPQKG